MKDNKAEDIYKLLSSNWYLEIDFTSGYTCKNNYN